MEQIKLEKSCGAVVYKIEDNTYFSNRHGKFLNAACADGHVVTREVSVVRSAYVAMDDEAKKTGEFL